MVSEVMSVDNVILLENSQLARQVCSTWLQGVLTMTCIPTFVGLVFGQ